MFTHPANLHQVSNRCAGSTGGRDGSGPQGDTSCAGPSHYSADCARGRPLCRLSAMPAGRVVLLLPPRRPAGAEYVLTDAATLASGADRVVVSRCVRAAFHGGEHGANGCETIAPRLPQSFRSGL